jgi:hypothetical protein
MNGHSKLHSTSPSARRAGVAEVYYFDFGAATQPGIMAISGSGIKKPPGEPDGCYRKIDEN